MFDNGRMLGLPFFGKYDASKTSNLTDPIVSISPKDANNELGNVHTVGETLAENILKKPHLRHLYHSFKILDLKKEIEYVARVCQYDLSKDQIDYFQQVFEDRLKRIDASLLKISESRKKYTTKSCLTAEVQEQTEDHTDKKGREI